MADVASGFLTAVASAKVVSRTIAIALAAMALLAPPADASGRAVTIASLDGVTLAGELYEASSRPAPAVVLVHMFTRSKADWGSLPDKIQDAGITALTIDLRGHGGSSGSPQSLADMVQDVRAAAQWLAARPGVRPGSIGLVGASLGASLSLLAAPDLPAVRAIALLSPSLDYRGLRTDVNLVKRIGGRALWLAASAEDPLALRTLRDFAAEPSGPREQMISNAVAHGTALLERDADVGRALVDWLRRSLLS
ncbi:MAG: alpha/beta fold hydrolase [Vicinamibacterales bacterium]|jgi:alpha-beta hydrolase superfamily lysophospholipase